VPLAVGRTPARPGSRSCTQCERARARVIVLLTDTLLPDDKKIDVTEIAAELRMRRRGRQFDHRQALLEFKSVPCWSGSCRGSDVRQRVSSIACVTGLL